MRDGAAAVFRHYSVCGGGKLDLGLKECSICLGGKKRRNFKWEKEEEVH